MTTPEAQGQDPLTELAAKAADCIGSLVASHRNAERTYEAATPELRGMAGMRADEAESVLRGATILAEHMGITPPGGHTNWGEFTAAAGQMADDAAAIGNQPGATPPAGSTQA